MFSFKKYILEKIHYLKFCMSCSAGQAGHLTSPLIKASIIEHVKTCRAKSSKCNFCDTIGHYESVYRKKKAVRELTSIKPESQLQSDEDAEESGIYNINIFRVTHTNPHQLRHTSQTGALPSERTGLKRNRQDDSTRRDRRTSSHRTRPMDFECCDSTKSKTERYA